MIKKIIDIPKSITKKKIFNLVGNQYLILTPLGDIHYDISESNHFDESFFVKSIKSLLEKNSYFFGMGDFFDLLAHFDRQALKHMRDDAKRQLDYQFRDIAYKFIKLLEPTKGRWLGMVKGNHTWTFADETNIEQLLCSELGCQYFGTEGLVRIRLEGNYEVYYDIIAHHGTTAPRTVGGNLNMIEQMVRGFDADAYMMAHSHSSVMGTFNRVYMMPNGDLVEKQKLLVRTPSWYRTYTDLEPLPNNIPAYKSDGCFGEVRAFNPSTLGCFYIGIGYEKVNGFYIPKSEIATIRG